MSMDPILLIGGTGALGRKIAEWLSRAPSRRFDNHRRARPGARPEVCG
jgi:hypothetical protein